MKLALIIYWCDNDFHARFILKYFVIFCLYYLRPPLERPLPPLLTEPDELLLEPLDDPPNEELLDERDGVEKLLFD